MIAQIVQKLFGPVFQGVGNDAPAVESGGEFAELLTEAGEIGDESQAAVANADVTGQDFFTEIGGAVPAVDAQTMPAWAASILDTQTVPTAEQTLGAELAGTGAQESDASPKLDGAVPEIIGIADGSILAGKMGRHGENLPVGAFVEGAKIAAEKVPHSGRAPQPGQPAQISGQINASFDGPFNDLAVQGAEGQNMPLADLAATRASELAAGQSADLDQGSNADGPGVENPAKLTKLARSAAETVIRAEQIDWSQALPESVAQNSAQDSDLIAELQAELVKMADAKGAALPAQTAASTTAAAPMLATTFSGMAAQLAVQRAAMQDTPKAAAGDGVQTAFSAPHTGTVAATLAQGAGPMADPARAAAWVAFDRYMFEQRSDVTAEIDLPAFSGGEFRGHGLQIQGASGPTAALAAGSSFATPLSAQILPHAAAAQSGPVELVLSPAELGQLRFEIQHRAEGVQIVLSAERGDTLELLRRNGDQLLADFRAAGFSGASLSFGGWGAGQNQGDTAGAQTGTPFGADGTAQSAAGQPAAQTAAAVVAARAGLDPSRSLNMRV